MFSFYFFYLTGRILTLSQAKANVGANCFTSVLYQQNSDSKEKGVFMKNVTKDSIRLTNKHVVDLFEY